MFRTISIIVAAWIASLAGAADQPAPAHPLTPYLDDQTLAVIRVETAGTSIQTLQEALTSILDASRVPREQRKEISDALVSQAPANYDGWLNVLRNAGARRVYVPVQTPGPDVGGLLVVPIEQDFDAAALAQTLSFLGDAMATAAVRDGVMLAGDRRAVELARQAPPARSLRPDAIAALDATADGNIAVVLAPSADARKVMEAVQPELPRELGGGPITMVTRGLSWASVQIWLGPQPRIRFILQSPDAKSALELAKAMTAAAGDWKAGFDLIKPAQDGARLVGDFGPKELAAVAELLAPMALAERQAALVRLSAGNMQQIGTAIAMYVNDNKDQMPPDLKTLEDRGYAPEPILINPRKPAANPGYVYLKPDVAHRDIRNKSRTIIAYEAGLEEPLILLMADFHVEVAMPLAELRKGLAEGRYFLPPPHKLPE